VIARVITYLICGGFAAMFLYVGVMQWWQQRRNLTHAEQVDATIVHATVTSSTTRDTDQRVGFSNSTTTHSPEVRFRYVVAGATYESTRLYPSIIERSYASAESAREQIAPYPLGATVRAWVNPAHPEQAFLIAERGNGPVVFIVLGVLMPVVGWLVGKIV
jgi:hypothetical protein